MKFAARAPVRIDPAGGGTDAPPYSIEYGGCVVNFAVARYSYAQFQFLPAGAGVNLYSLDMRQGAHAKNLSSLQYDGKLFFVKAFARRLLTSPSSVEPPREPPRGRDDFLLVTQSDVPLRTGLGG